jgi:hypothetical protein
MATSTPDVRPHPLGATADAATEARVLRGLAVLFTVAVLVHNGDHLRRGGDAVAGDVFLIGTAAIFVEVAIVALVLRGGPSAPLAAISALPLAVGYVVVHFTPERSWLSDSFVEGGASAISIAAASLESASAMALGLAGLWALRARGGLAGAGAGAAAAGDPPLPLATVLRHPAVLAMAAGNAVILVGSVLTL